jgi:hypothetical protein
MARMLLLLLSCSGKGDDSHTPAADDSDSRGPLIDDTGDSTPQPCGIDIEPIRPVAGDDDAYYRADIEYLLSMPDETAVVGLRTDPEEKGKKGDPIAGKQWRSIDETIVYFTPDEPLALDTDYRSEIDWCGGRQTIPFHTSWIGQPVKAPKDLVGTVWRIDLGEGRWIEPRAAMDGVITTYLQSTFLVSVELVDDNWIRIEGARSLEDGAQDICSATADFAAANFTENPYFSAGPDQLTFRVADVTLVLEDVEIEGAFTADGSGFEWVEVKGVFDSRPLDEPLKGKDSLGAACHRASLAGSECIPCPSDGKPYCLALHVDEISASPTDASVESIAENCSHPKCKSAECAKKWE